MWFAHLQSQCWGGKDRWVPEARWLANLDYARNSRLLGDPVLETRWMAPVEWHPRLTSDLQISAYMYTYKHSGVQTVGVALIPQIQEAKGAWCCPLMPVLCIELSYQPRTHFLACGCFWGSFLYIFGNVGNRWWTPALSSHPRFPVFTRVLGRL